MSYRHRKVKSRKQKIVEALPVEQQAQELIGADWFKMSAKDQADFTAQMQREGLIGKKMAEGGEVVEAITIPEKLWNSINSSVREQLLRENLVMAEDEPMYEFTLKKIRKMAFLPYDMLPAEYQANVEKATKMGWGGKVMAEGGRIKVTDGDDTFYLTYIDSTHFFLSNSPEYKGNPYHIGQFRSRPFYNEVNDWLKNHKHKMAEGGAVGEKVKVTFTLAGGKTVTKTYDSKADSDEGIADFMLENDVEDIKVEEEKKKSLLDIVKKVEKKGAKSKDKPTVEIDGAESDIAEYKRLNEKIKMLTADKELIGGKLKAIGKEKFVELYEQKNRTPENFLLADGDESILFMVQDKYIKVTPEKEAMLENYGKGLVETVTTYKFTELIEKKLPNGQTIGEVVVGLIMDSSVIPENDKMNLITAESVTRVPKGTIDRLMEYDNPEEVFNLIEPITALK